MYRANSAGAFFSPKQTTSRDNKKWLHFMRCRMTISNTFAVGFWLIFCALKTLCKID
jgi:hypothetical protein